MHKKSKKKRLHSCACVRGQMMCQGKAMHHPDDVSLHQLPSDDVSFSCSAVYSPASRSPTQTQQPHSTL